MLWAVVGVVVALTLLLFWKDRQRMADLKQVNDTLDGISLKVTDIAAEIAALKATPALVTQEQLDALDVKTQAISAALDAAK